MYVPSYDFRIFDIPMFSPLQAQEFGADTTFSANTPVSYIDHSLNQFAGLTNPNAAFPYIQSQFPSIVDKFNFDEYFNSFQSPSRQDIEAEVEKRRIEFEKAREAVTKPTKCPEGYSPVSVFGIFSYCGKKMVSDGQGTIGDKEAPAGMQSLENFMNALPKGSGIFLIAVVVIILLLLFVKR